MKIAKYTLYIEIDDLDQLTTKGLQDEINQKVLDQSALNGKCLLVEEASRTIDTDDWDCDDWDNRPLNFTDNINNPEVWEKELKGR